MAETRPRRPVLAHDERIHPHPRIHHARTPRTLRDMLAIALARRRLAQIPSVAALRSRAYTQPPPSGLDEGEQNIYAKLTDRFQPTELAVQDVSGAFVH